MSRPPLDLGTWGRIKRTDLGDGRWKASCRFRDLDGRTRQVKRFAETGAAAERALLAALRDRVAPSDELITPDTTLAVLGESWFSAGCDEREWSSNTKSAYRFALDSYVGPGVGGVRLREVTVPLVERLVKLVADRHGAAAGRRTHTVMSGMLGTAARLGALPTNPLRDVTRPRTRRDATRALSPDEVVELRRLVRAWVSGRDDRPAKDGKRRGGRPRDRSLPDLVDVMLATGCRIGEVLAIRWQDLDLEGAKPTVTVSGTIVRVAGRGLVRQAHPKTDESWRTLRLPRFAVEVFLRRQVEQVEPNAYDVVFGSTSGTLRDPNNAEKSWRRCRADESMKAFTWVKPHAFRRTVATYLAGDEDLSTASSQLGHASQSTTERFYVANSHQGPDVAAALDRMVQGPGSGKA